MRLLGGHALAVQAVEGAGGAAVERAGVAAEVDVELRSRRPSRWPVTGVVGPATVPATVNVPRLARTARGRMSSQVIGTSRSDAVAERGQRRGRQVGRLSDDGAVPRTTSVAADVAVTGVAAASSATCARSRAGS